MVVTLHTHSYTAGCVKIIDMMAIRPFEEWIEETFSRRKRVTYFIFTLRMDPKSYVVRKTPRGNICEKCLHKVIVGISGGSSGYALGVVLMCTHVIRLAYSNAREASVCAPRNRLSLSGRQQLASCFEMWLWETEIGFILELRYHDQRSGVNFIWMCLNLPVGQWWLNTVYELRSCNTITVIHSRVRKRSAVHHADSFESHRTCIAPLVLSILLQ